MNIPVLSSRHALPTVVRRFVLFAPALLVLACNSGESQEARNGAASPGQREELSLAVVPYISAPHLYDAFSPLADHLSRVLGVPVRIKTAADFSEFMKVTLRERYELVVSNPYLYLRLNREGGYEPLVADGRPFRTLIAARQDGAVRDVQDLRDRRIGVLNGSAFAGFLLPMDYLRSVGMHPGRDFETVSHSSFDLILTALLNEEIDAGCFWAPHYESLSQETKGRMRVIAATKSFVNDPYAVRADLPAQWKSDIRDALLMLNEDQDSREVLRAIGVRNFIPVTDSDYHTVREFARRNNLPF